MAAVKREGGMSLRFDIRDFGAVGDGRTDNTAALQKAVDAAAAVQGTLWVPPGVHCTGTLRWHPRVGLCGEPTWSFADFGGSILRLNDAAATCLIDLTGAIGATLNGVCLDGGGLGSGVHGVLVDKADFGRTEDTPRIERCRISRFSGDGVRLNRIWCFSIRGCMVSHNTGHGVWVRGWDGFLLDNWLSGNGGAGYAAFEENLSITMTGNRIEWNRGGGLVSRGGGHYNVTGNYIDRSGGPGIWFAPRGTVPCTVIAITGNVVYRSGRPEWCPVDDPDASCHIRLEGCRGLSCCGNSMNASMDDRGKGGLSPRFGMVLADLADCVVKDNTLYHAAVEQVMVDRGGHSKSTIIRDNVGRVFDPQRTPKSELNAAWADPAW